jgi:GT2 family glycosyltransferase
MSSVSDQQQSRSETAPLVVCVLVNWNGWRDTVPCLHSLAAQQYPALKVLVVDNASTDDSLEQIRVAAPDVELLRSPINGGFSAGCNIGIRVALERGAAFVWLLNNDTLAPPDTLSKLVASASDARTGMVGSVLYYAHNPSQVQAWGGGSVARWIGFGSHYYEPAAMGSNSFLTFASVLLRRELFEEVGLMDEGFFMYFEDADLCFRARDAGWQLVVAAGTAVLHKEGGSAVSRNSPRTDRWFTASGLRFLGRHGRPRVLSQMLYVLSRLGKRALRLQFAGMRAVRQGVRDWRRDDPRAFQREQR